MKKLLLLFTVVFVLLTLIGCNKKVDRSQFDEGNQMDANDSAAYSEENPGDPYAQSEIGLHRAYKNLVIVMGAYDRDLESYVKYEYVKDHVYNGAPCYVYSKMISKDQYGEYKHHSYVAVYKDGSYITPIESIN